LNEKPTPEEEMLASMLAVQLLGTTKLKQAEVTQQPVSMWKKNRTA
jgi:hypothetical protein